MKNPTVYLFACIVLIISQYSAASVGKIPDGAMRANADLIIIGRVMDIQSIKIPLSSKEIPFIIVSRARIAPESIIKGEADGTPISIEFAGGQIGDEISVVEDSPNLTIDEKVILFLKKITGSEAYSIIGMNQGKFQITDGMVTKRNIPVQQFIQELKIAPPQ